MPILARILRTDTFLGPRWHDSTPEHCARSIDCIRLSMVCFRKMADLVFLFIILSSQILISLANKVIRNYCAIVQVFSAIIALLLV